MAAQRGDRIPLVVPQEPRRAVVAATTGPSSRVTVHRLKPPRPSKEFYPPGSDDVHPVFLLHLHLSHHTRENRTDEYGNTDTPRSTPSRGVVRHTRGTQLPGPLAPAPRPRAAPPRGETHHHHHHRRRHDVDRRDRGRSGGRTLLPPASRGTTRDLSGHLSSAHGSDLPFQIPRTRIHVSPAGGTPGRPGRAAQLRSPSSRYHRMVRWRWRWRSS